MSTQKFIEYLVVAALLFWPGWAIYAVAIDGHGSVPGPVLAILLRNYLVVVVFPIWAIACWIFVLAFDAVKQNTFDVQFGGLKFKGSGGLVVAWVISTMLGWLIIGLYWQNLQQ